MSWFSTEVETQTETDVIVYTHTDLLRGIASCNYKAEQSHNLLPASENGRQLLAKHKGLGIRRAECVNPPGDSPVRTTSSAVWGCGSVLLEPGANSPFLYGFVLSRPPTDWTLPTAY